MGLVTMYTLLQGYLSRLPGSMREEDVIGDDGTRDEGQALRLHTALAPGDDRNAPSRRRGGHHQGQGTARAPARDDHSDLRQAHGEA